MINWSHVKRMLAKVCETLRLMILGALLFAAYLSNTYPPDAWLGQHIWPIFLLPFWTFTVLAAWLQPRTPNKRASVVDLAPKWSGVSVVLATGLTAAFAYGIGFVGSKTLMGVVAIITVTIVTAVAIWRFASSHEGEIGEARFGNDTAI